MGEEKKKLNPILSAMTYAFDFTYSILLTYSKFVLLIIVFIVSAEVISRKFLGGSIRWSEEVALFFMVWMAFISMAIGVQKNLHIALGFFFSLLPPMAAKIVNKLDLAVIMGFGCFMVYYGAKLVQSTMTSTLPATSAEAPSADSAEPCETWLSIAAPALAPIARPTARINPLMKFKSFLPCL